MNIRNIFLMLMQLNSSAPYSIIVIQELGTGKQGLWHRESLSQKKKKKK